MQMSREELQNHIDKLRDALKMLPANGASELPRQGLTDLGFAVDSVRKSVWGVLIAEHTGDYYDFLGKIRVRRATETCRDVMTDLQNHDVTPTTPGFEVFHATLRELAHAGKTVSS
jgi:hypothetical protein